MFISTKACGRGKSPLTFFNLKLSLLGVGQRCLSSMVLHKILIFLPSNSNHEEAEMTSYEKSPNKIFSWKNHWQFKKAFSLPSISQDVLHFCGVLSPGIHDSLISSFPRVNLKGEGGRKLAAWTYFLIQ